ncbi:MAG: hypothetical protein ACI82I_001885 [Gammaproteobacteria bacterium]
MQLGLIQQVLICRTIGLELSSLIQAREAFIFEIKIKVGVGLIPSDEHPMCNDAVWMKRMAAIEVGSEFSSDVDGVFYMLADLPCDPFVGGGPK